MLPIKLPPGKIRVILGKLSGITPHELPEVVYSTAREPTALRDVLNRSASLPRLRTAISTITNLLPDAGGSLKEFSACISGQASQSTDTTLSSQGELGARKYCPSGIGFDRVPTLPGCGVGVFVTVGSGVAVAAGVGVFVAVGLGVGSGVAEVTGVAVAVGIEVGVGVACPDVGVAVGV